MTKSLPFSARLFYTSPDDVSWLSLDIHPWYDKKGEVVGIIIYQDITDDTPDVEQRYVL